MKKLILTLTIAVTLSVSCTTAPKDGVITCTESSKGDVTSEIVCKLGENIDFISDVVLFKIVDDNSLVIVTRTQIYLYNMKGEQIRKIGSQGRARGEYMSMSSLASYKGDIYVGCLNGDKVIHYNSQGKVVQEYKVGNKSYKDLSANDKYIFMYHPIGVRDGETTYAVTIFDKASGEIKAPVDEYDEVDKVYSISMLSNGFISGDDDYVTLLKASDLTLRKYNIITGEYEQLLDIDSPSYKLDTSVEYDDISQSSKVEQMIEFLESNSSPMCAQIHDDKLIFITNESVSGGRMGDIKYRRHLIEVDTKKGKGEYRQIEYLQGSPDVRYNMYNGDVYSLTLIDGEYYIRKMNI